MGYVLVKFTRNPWRHRAGLALDRAGDRYQRSELRGRDGERHVEGHLTLNDDPVRCIADIDLATLKGTGRLSSKRRSRQAASDSGALGSRGEMISRRDPRSCRATPSGLSSTAHRSC